MQKTSSGWVVVDRQAGVLTRDYSFGSGHANTFVARIAEGKLLVISPCLGLTEAAARELAEFGEVHAVVANNGFHHLGIAEWRKRYPEARFFAAPLTAARIHKKNPEAGSFEPLEALQPLLAGSDVGLREAPKTRCGESWAWAKLEEGYALYASDVLANMTDAPLHMRALMRLTKSGPGYSVFNLGLRFIVKDKRAVLATLLEDVRSHPPSIVVPAHGPLLEGAGLAQQTEQLVQAHC